MLQIYTCLTIEHDLRLVALAAAVCLLASWVTIGLFHRARAARGHARLGWLCLDAAAGGCGIWATHFISMLAYDPGVGEGYNLPLTALSLLFAVIVTGIGLSVALSDFSTKASAIGGAIVGGGIAAMHFTGMLALELPGHIGWSAGLATTSVALGLLFGGLAFAVAGKHDNLRLGLAGAALLATAIVAHHFTAMGAVIFTPDPTQVTTELSVSSATLALIVAGSAAVILGMSVVAALSDRRSEDKLRHQKGLLDAALQNVSQGVCMFDAEGRVVLYNERYIKMMGFSAEPLQGCSLLDLLKLRKQSGDFLGDPEEFFTRVTTDARLGKSSSKVMESLSGRALRVLEQPMADGGWVATFEDITERRRNEAEIFRLARYDTLTGLVNRAVFNERLDDESKCHARDGREFTVMMLDLDKFKTVNDTLGHHAGDLLLVEVARRLKVSIRESDILARLGGDEFAIIIGASPNQREAAASLALRIIEAVSAPFDLNGHQACIGTGVGLALAPEDGVDADDLLKKPILRSIPPRQKTGTHIVFTGPKCWKSFIPSGRRRANCGTRSRKINSSCTINPSSTSIPANSAVLKPCCAGGIRPKDWSLPTGSFRWRNRPA
jgi:diguanylate cyclase (GGDEF)-like protein/PAS domain S-box-containing protein